MAQRPRPDRRPHEALPRRRWPWHGIESGAARRLSSFVIQPVDHAFQKLPEGEMMMPVVFVGTNTPSTLNIPRPGIDFGFAVDRCHGPLTFVFSFRTHSANQKF